MTSTALYPGSFDPLTNGHIDVIGRALKVFDNVIVAVARNTRKQPLFTVEERVDMIQQVFKENDCVQVQSFQGLTVHYAAHCGASAIVRGLRAVADFEYELQMANMNRKLDPNVETLFMMTSERYFFVSSKSVKEVANLGGDVSEFLPPYIAGETIKKLNSIKRD